MSAAAITVKLGAKIAWWVKPFIWVAARVHVLSDGRLTEGRITAIAMSGVSIAVARRPFVVRMWRSYKGWRTRLGVWASIRAAWRINGL